MIGTLLCQVFVDSMHMPLGKISAAKSMLAKVDFPREAIVLAGLGEVLLNFVIRGALVIVVFFWFGLPIGVTVLLVPVGIAVLMSFGAMIGTLLTPLAWIIHAGLLVGRREKSELFAAEHLAGLKVGV